MTTESKTWEMFAQQSSSETLHNFYTSLLAYGVCGPDPVFHVQVTLDPEGPYYGWLYSDDPANGSNVGHVSMIFAHRMLVEICFPYGTAVEEKRGRGKIVRLRVERLELASR